VQRMEHLDQEAYNYYFRESINIILPRGCYVSSLSTSIKENAVSSGVSRSNDMKKSHRFKPKLTWFGLSNSSVILLECEITVELQQFGFDSKEDHVADAFSAFSIQANNTFRNSSPMINYLLKSYVLGGSNITTALSLVHYTAVVLHSPFPTSVPTSMPSCGAGAEGVTATCTDCEPGFYSERDWIDCRPCPQGMYSDEYRSGSCKQCPYPSTTYREGLSDCFSYSLYGESFKGLTIAIFVVWSLFFIILALGNGLISIASFPFLYVIMPLCSFILDILYWQTTMFYTIYYFIGFIFLIISPIFVLLLDLYSKKCLFNDKEKYDKPKWLPMSFTHKTARAHLFWLRCGEHYYATNHGNPIKIPFINEKLFPQNGSDLFGFIRFVVAWILVFVAQLISIMLYVLWTLFNIIIWFISISIALIGIKTKVLVLRNPFDSNEKRDWYHIW
jgi:hypothetical protein